MRPLTFMLLALIIPATGCAQNKEIQLPDPITTGGMPLMEVLKNRKSTREFSEQKIDDQTLSNLLWATFGYSRLDEKKRTAPTARNKQELEIYCAMENGLYLWDAERNVLTLITKDDIRATTGQQDFVASAPLNLIFVCNNDKLDGTLDEVQRRYVFIDTGYLSENAYLYCASAGLVTVVRGNFDSEALTKAMQLPDNQWIVITQTVGYPK
ncbi:MAG: SagB/ThcOx family dehydrogenase [Bacteroidales bacterium]|nr:SagB/ThcOx family dehydrogenase [Bacteroidales bacterium]